MKNKIIYRIATGWLALGMTSTGIVQLLKNQKEVDNFTHLGYPLYLMTLIGTWKILGVIAVLIPKFPRLREWAYAGDPKNLFGPSLLLVLTVVSWHYSKIRRHES